MSSTIGKLLDCSRCMGVLIVALALAAKVGCTIWGIHDDALDRLCETALNIGGTLTGVGVGGKLGATIPAVPDPTAGTTTATATITKTDAPKEGAMP